MDYNNNIDRVTNFQIVLLPTANTITDIESASKIARYLECEAALRLAEKAERLKEEEWNRSKRRVLEEKSKLEELKHIITVPAPNTITLRPAPGASRENTAGSPDQQVTSTGDLYGALSGSESTTFTIYPPPKRIKLFGDTGRSTEEDSAVLRRSTEQGPQGPVGNSSTEPVNTVPAENTGPTLASQKSTEPSASVSGTVASKPRKSIILLDSLPTNTQSKAKKNPAGPKRKTTRSKKTAPSTSTKSTPLCTSTPKIKTKNAQIVTSRSAKKSLFEPNSNVNKEQSTDGKKTGSVEYPAPLSSELNATLILTPEEPEVPAGPSTASVGDVALMSVQSRQEVKAVMSTQEKVAPIDKKSTTRDIIALITSIEKSAIEIPVTDTLGFPSALKQRSNPMELMRIAPYTSNRSTLVNLYTKNGIEKVDKTVNATNRIVPKAQNSQTGPSFMDSSIYAQTTRKPTRPTLPVSIKADTERLRALIQEKAKDATSGTKIPQLSPPAPKFINRFPFQPKRPEVPFPRRFEGPEMTHSAKKKEEVRRGSMEEPINKITPPLRKRSKSLCRPKENIVTEAELIELLNKPDDVLSQTSAGTSYYKTAEGSNLQSRNTPMNSGHADHVCNGIEAIMPKISKPQDRVSPSSNGSIKTPDSSIKKKIHSPETAYTVPKQVPYQDTYKMKIRSPDAINRDPRILNPVVMEGNDWPLLDIEKVLGVLYGPDTKRLPQEVIDLVVANKEDLHNSKR